MVRFLAGVVAAWLACGAAAAQEVVLTSGQAQALAERAVLAGDFASAERLSALVLAGDPDNARALLVRAAVARAAGVFRDADALGRRAHAAADDPLVRFEAAMLVADVRARQERFLTSQYWLRLADQAAVDDRRRAMVAEAYRLVARQNPLSLQLRFTAQPSNNVNNGAETTVIEIGGLPFTLDPSGQQLGGFEASVGLSFGYRLSLDEVQRTDLLGEVFYRKVWLDSDAKAAAPGVEGSDFDYGAAIVGVRQSRVIWPELGVSRATGLIGQSWYGGEPLARWGEVQLSQAVQQGEAALLTFGAAVRAEKRLDDDVNSNRSLALSVDRAQVIDGMRLSYGASVKNTWSDSATVDAASVTLRGAWAFGDLGGVQPTLTGSVERRNYHKFATATDGRRDTTAALGLNLVFSDYSFYGFLPQLQVQARRTWSNVDIYDRNAFSVGLTAVSRF